MMLPNELIGEVEYLKIMKKQIFTPIVALKETETHYLQPPTLIMIKRLSLNVTNHPYLFSILVMLWLTACSH